MVVSNYIAANFWEKSYQGREKLINHKFLVELALKVWSLFTRRFSYGFADDRDFHARVHLQPPCPRCRCSRGYRRPGDGVRCLSCDFLIEKGGEA